MLENMVKQLNDISKCRYSLTGSYSQVGIYKNSMECTGVSDLSIGNTKKELYYQLRMLLDWHSFEKRSKQDYVKNCTHHDVFNLHSFKDGEKRDESNIREYTETKGKGKNKKEVTYYQCLTCKKRLSKKVYDQSHIPKDVETLRSMRIE